jgi:hypothetical protein
VKLETIEKSTGIKLTRKSNNNNNALAHRLLEPF